MKQPNLWSKFKKMSFGNKLYVVLASLTVLLFSHKKGVVPVINATIWGALWTTNISSHCFLSIAVKVVHQEIAVTKVHLAVVIEVGAQ